MHDQTNTGDVESLRIELDSAREREAAIRDILESINRSRADEAPVFDMILGYARRLCDAPFSALVMAQPGDAHQRMVAHHGAKDSTVELYRTGGVPMDPERSFAAQAIFSQQVVHLHDMSDTEEYRSGIPNIASLVDEQGIRTNLFVPLITTNGGVGCFILFRHEARPFDESQIELVKTFAEQAVIAIENVRQFREIQTRLEREAATSEILQVISQSRDDEMPVFRAILSRGERLCDAEGSGLQLLNEAGTHLVMQAGMGYDKGSFPNGYEFDLNDPIGMCIAVREGRVVHIRDLKDTELYKQGHQGRRKLVDVEGTRTHLNVPLMRDGIAFGNISMGRKEQKPFSPDEIALVETFAAQAVIAIENVRQFREMQTRLEREAATRDILQVISQSRDDEQPVFEAILKNSSRLCNAPLAFLTIVNEARTRVTVPAALGEGAQKNIIGFNQPIDASHLIAVRPIVDGKVIHMPDCSDDDLYRNRNPHRVTLVEDEGIRTILAVPMISNGISLGAIMLYRREIKPFEDDQIELIKTFAKQAAIAIENVRQFRELQVQLQREQASAEILKVINEATSDLQPGL